MTSLRSFHIIFMLIAIIITDMFGAWAVHEHAQTKDTITLVLGVLSFLLGFGVIGYAIWFVKKLDRAHIE